MTRGYSPNSHIAVVTGLPRSGTSLMMQMLAAGGMPVLADERRPADAGNPRGYLEFEPVKRTRQDTSWIAEAPGKAVKVVHALLDALPTGPQYRVLFIRRDLDEVLASQAALLGQLNRSGSAIPRERLAAALAAQLSRARAWLEQQPNVRVLDIEHRALILNPPDVAARVNQFLGGGLDEGRMSAVVDPALYRHRSPGP